MVMIEAGKYKSNKAFRGSGTVALFRKFRRSGYHLPGWIVKTKIGDVVQLKPVYCVFLVDIGQLMKSFKTGCFILHGTSSLRMSITVIYETGKEKGCLWKHPL
jgi:hypothetical protein